MTDVTVRTRRLRAGPISAVSAMGLLLVACATGCGSSSSPAPTPQPSVDAGADVTNPVPDTGMPDTPVVPPAETSVDS